MSKVSSYKKLYYIGVTFVLIIASLVIFSVSYITKQYNIFGKDSKENIVDTSFYLPDTIYKEKIIEKRIVDTFKVYVPVKPKIEKSDSTTTPSLPVSNQSQN